MLLHISNLGEINKLQENIMYFIDDWVHKEKTPVPHKQIINNIKGVAPPTIIKALNCLLKKGYIRRSVVMTSRTSYVQLRRV